MKFRMLKGKKICAVTLAAVVMLTGMKAYLASAANAITEDDCKVTISIPKEVREDCNAELEVILYKIADVTRNGAYENEVVEGLVKDLSTYVGENKAEHTDKVIATASKYVSDLSDEEKKALEATRTTIPANASSATVSIEKGLYLITFADSYIEGNEKGYAFEDSILSAPMNYYVENSSSTDEWVYEFDINLKYGEKPIFGNLLIDKSLITYNTSLSDACFVYTVEAFKGDKLVYSNAVSMDFSGAGDNQVEVKGIPAHTRVVVTEAYTGATYEVVGDKVQTVDSLPSEYDVAHGSAEAEVAYVNDYNDDLMTGSVATVNTVTHTDEGFGLEYIGGKKASDNQ